MEKQNKKKKTARQSFIRMYKKIVPASFLALTALTILSACGKGGGGAGGGGPVSVEVEGAAENAELGNAIMTSLEAALSTPPSDPNSVEGLWLDVKSYGFRGEFSISANEIAIKKDCLNLDLDVKSLYVIEGGYLKILSSDAKEVYTNSRQCRAELVEGSYLMERNGNALTLTLERSRDVKLELKRIGDLVKQAPKERPIEAVVIAPTPVPTIANPQSALPAPLVEVKTPPPAAAPAPRFASVKLADVVGVSCDHGKNSGYDFLLDLRFSELCQENCFLKGARLYNTRYQPINSLTEADVSGRTLRLDFQGGEYWTKPIRIDLAVQDNQLVDLKSQDSNYSCRPITDVAALPKAPKVLSCEDSTELYLFEGAGEDQHFSTGFSLPRWVLSPGLSKNSLTKTHLSKIRWTNNGRFNQNFPELHFYIPLAALKDAGVNKTHKVLLSDSQDVNGIQSAKEASSSLSCTRLPERKAKAEVPVKEKPSSSNVKSKTETKKKK